MNSNFNDNLKSTRHGFTLVELLFVIAIIAVLGGMAAGVLSKAKKDAEIAATRSRITQIEAIMQTVTEDLEVRRLPFRNSQLASFFPAGRNRRVQITNLRRRIVAAMIQAEFPGPLFDGTDFMPNPNIGILAPDTPAPIDTESLGNFRDWAQNIPNLLDYLDNGFNPTAEMLYWQSVAALDALDPENDLDLPGEYLYLILERIDIDGSSALESLGPNVIGNSDEDNFPEIVDAFGDSMQLRIVQVEVTNNTVPVDDIWGDVAESEINWNRLEPLDINGDQRTKIPSGYQFLNPVVPRLINKIRFQVVSPNLEEIE